MRENISVTVVSRVTPRSCNGLARRLTLVLHPPAGAESERPARAIAVSRHHALTLLEQRIEQVGRVELARDRLKQREPHREIHLWPRLLVRVRIQWRNRG